MTLWACECHVGGSWKCSIAMNSQSGLSEESFHGVLVSSVANFAGEVFSWGFLEWKKCSEILGKILVVEREVCVFMVGPSEICGW